MLPSLRILHVTPYAGDAWAYGGIPRVVQAMATGLMRRGHRVSICTTDACDATRRLESPTGRAPWSSRDAVSGAALHVFPNVSNRLAYHGQLFLPRGLYTFLRQRSGDFDVAHLHACRNLPGIIAARHLRAAGVPYLLGPNGTAPNLERRRAVKYLFDRLLGQQPLHGASRVLAVSAAERADLLALGVRPSRMAGVPNPIDLDQFATELPRGVFRASAGLASAPVVLFLGKLTPRKRVDVLIKAFARVAVDGGPLAAARLVIAGNDMGAGASLRALVHRLGLDSRTIFAGLLEGSARLHALADADVVVYPSQDEAFGLVPLESLLAGTPVIVGNDSGCGETISRLGGGLTVPPGDVDALARALISVLTANVVPGDDVSAAASRARSEFSTEAVCASLEDEYRRVMDEEGVRTSRRVRNDLPAPVPTPAPGMLVVVPAHNEALNLPQVVAGLKAAVPSASILVIDDGSTDDTAAVLDALDVRWLGWPERRGVGAAVRAGLRYAARGGFTAVVRVDADGQHDAGDIRQLVAPILDGSADVTLGSRFCLTSSGAGMTGLLRGTLAALMSLVIGRRVTDPTSGFCALSARATRLLATHYPDGYAEPELQLFLSRNRVSCLEVPVQVRQRLSGTSSLTAPRLVGACARVMLALLIVPLRRVEASPHD